MKKTVLFLVFIILIFGCTVAPSKIEYGKDACHFCKMTIVEQTHAAQIVTKKGKPFKYDAIECMLNDLTERNTSDIEYFLVTDYLSPAKLIDAKKAVYLISKGIKSPMGANLSAFETKEKANKYVTVTDDQLYNWSEINLKFKN